jgi:hypothetical protein
MQLPKRGCKKSKSKNVKRVYGENRESERERERTNNILGWSGWQFN